MKYKLNPDHCYIVVFVFFLVSAGLKFAVESACVESRGEPVPVVAVSLSPVVDQ
jgi:hypothetical protein